MFESILTITDTAVANYVFDIWKSFAIQGEPFLRIMLILYVVITGYLILIQRLEMSVHLFFTRVFKGMFIYVLLTNVGIMTHFIYNIFIDVPEAISSWVISTLSGIPASPKTEAGINNMIGALYDQGMEVVAAIWKKGGLNNLLAYLYGFIVMLANIFLTAYTLLLLCLSKIAMGVMLGLAPFFIITYFFANTKGLFDAWLRQVITFALVPIIVYALYTIILVITLAPMAALLSAANNSSPDLTQIAPFLIVNFIAILLLTQVLNWAQTLGGGMQLNSMGAARGLKNMSQKAVEKYRALGNKGGGGSGSKSPPKRQNMSNKNSPTQNSSSNRRPRK